MGAIVMGKTRRIVVISPDRISAMLVEGKRFEIVKGLPPDTELIAANFDAGFDEYYLCFQNPNFPVVEEGLQYPEIEVVVKEI